MPLLDKISDLASRFAPSKHAKPSSAGIGSGMGPIDDDMIVSKPTIILHTSQIFFNFLAMACFASVASFQAKWHVGPSGLSGFALFVSISGMFLSAFMLGVPVAYEKYDKFVRLARALKEVRVGFILTGTGVTFSLLIAFVVTISAWTQPGCKNKDNDPHSESLGDDFKNGLPGWCSTKKAAAIFFWFAFAFWAASLVMLVLDWRSGKLHAHTQRDPPFQRPQTGHDEEDADMDDDASYMHVAPARRTTATASPAYDDDAAQSPFADPYPGAQRYGAAPPSSSAYTPALQQHQPLAGRPSMDAYGAFSDPAPSGFGGYGGSNSNANSNTSSMYAGTGTASPARTAAPPVLPEPDMGGPMVSRTMQYADPYAAVRASVGGGGGKVPTSPGAGGPPGYESYSGYR
ncbi:hypothetical protein CVT25_010827 [Psilocybe cyanescens]|uniref:MARVEL domain-containing protein n=1 Tax=Psilocybe cyanescens TaxID=93625 RepID=A0A409WF72_PSICY|nr:hypothetical protein CVT25_010827 [Psilocybe cyanescens]